ncbi:1-acyl-sn-glycerol-3-phosphate acyltransferase [Propionivibrio sp.]|uniref:1-acyl-sn-glycerol-3-phosphate acyltransferase n=1 Tax=Propionivibrio sp. TaxID=2212460 RepID=UPI0039E6B6B8
MLKRAWFAFLYRNMARFAFHRVRASGAPVPQGGPVLYACLHRNGAIDGMVYRQVVPRARATLSSQLRRRPWMRLIFDGIELVRAKDREQDGARVDNAASFDRCVEHLAGGGQLMFFPEGTSELGPRHLKFHAGIALLVQAALERLPALTVVPLAAHYEAATEWQSDVDVEVGAAIVFTGRPRAAEIMRAVTRGLETVGLDCDTPEERAATETLAYAATLGQRDIAYARALHAMHGASPAAWEALRAAARTDGLRLHQGVPLVPTRRPALYLLPWLCLTPLLGAAAALNLPVLIAARLAPRRLADAPNVVALWRTLAGVGTAYLWVPAMAAAGLFLGGWAAAAAYLGVSLAGLRAVYRWRKLSIALGNRRRLPPQRRRELLAAHAAIVAEARRRIAAGGDA